MENKFQLLLYIIFGVIYVISRIMKNRNKPVDVPEHDREVEQQPKMTFEDLLKEFTGESKPKNEPEVVEKPSYEFEREIPSEVEIDKVYQQSIEEAQRYEETDAHKLRHDVEYKRFEKFEEEEENTFIAQLMDDMSEEDGMKKAIIYKEILDRKY